MSAEDIPPEVRAFIADHIESVVQLEVLLLLHANPARTWQAADIGRELRIDATWAAEQLVYLTARGILASATSGAGSDPASSASSSSAAVYQYRPRTGELDRAVRGLAAAYADRRVTVINLIFSKPLDKLRSFSDAFKLRRDDPGA